MHCFHNFSVNIPKLHMKSAGMMKSEALMVSHFVLLSYTGVLLGAESRENYATGSHL